MTALPIGLSGLARDVHIKQMDLVVARDALSAAVIDERGIRHASIGGLTAQRLRTGDDRDPMALCGGR